MGKGKRKNLFQRFWGWGGEMGDIVSWGGYRRVRLTTENGIVQIAGVW